MPNNIPQLVKKELKMNRFMAKDLVIDTIGMELESLFLSQEDVAIILNELPREYNDQFRVTKDASSEIKVYKVPFGKKDIRISSHTQEARDLYRGKLRDNVIGYEAVSKPILSDDAEKILFLLMPRLLAAGDTFNKRCAFHVHVGMARNLDVAKKALSVGLYMDDLFFKLAGMGRKFRGLENNSIYCRPLTSGPCITDGNSYYRVLNWKKALDAQDFTHFWYPFYINPNREFSKYTPGRYFSLNILSMLINGTIEFRYFNQSFNPLLMTSVIKLCQMISELIFKGKNSDIRRLPVADVFEDKSSSYYVNKLEKLIEMAHDSDCSYIPGNTYLNQLFNLIENSPPVGLRDVLVRTHLRDFIANKELIVLGDLERVRGNPVNPGHIDIHNIVDQKFMEG